VYTAADQKTSYQEELPLSSSERDLNDFGVLAFGSPIEGGKSALDLPLGSSQLIEMCFDDMMRDEELTFRGTDTVVHWRGSCVCKNPRRLTHIYKHYWTIIRGSILFEDCGSEDNSLKDKSRYHLYLSKNTSIQSC
jgi:hypothetical protein